MSSEHGIPVMNKPVDMMEVGANGGTLATAALRRHPVEELQQRQGACVCVCVCACVCLCLCVYVCAPIHGMG